MPIIPDASMLRAARLTEAYAYWESKRGERPMPSRRDIDPVEIPALLPYVTLIDVLSDPLDFRYRLIGTEVRNISEGNYAGKRFSELPSKGRGSVIWDTCEQTVLARSPFSQSPPYAGPEQSLRDCENLLLPLSEDGAQVNMIFRVISFELLREVSPARFGPKRRS